MLDGWSGTAVAFPDDVRADYARTFRDPKTLHAICEEYRASNVQSSRCGANRALPAWYDVLAVWRQVGR
jgi:hypothetical protein